MSFAFHTSSSLLALSCLNQNKIVNRNSTKSSTVTVLFPFVNGKKPFCITKHVNTRFGMKTLSTFGPRAVDFTDHNYHQSGEEDTVDLDFGDEEKEGDEGADSPWEGAIIYKRSSTTSTHVEYCTTLERLGLGKVSTEISKSRASEMGIRVTKAVKDYPFGTPVQVSVDVTKKKKRLRLDGIIKTVITLGCNRCGESAPESVFINFSLLLTDEPVKEPDVIDIGKVFAKDKSKTFTGIGEDGDEDDEASIDFDDRLHFPSGEKEIDISKNIRDLVHLEINISAVCGPKCKGLCLKCGTNLNTGVCNCSKQEEAKKTYGPLGNLKQKMQAKS